MDKNLSFVVVGVVCERVLVPSNIHFHSFTHSKSDFLSHKQM